MTIETLERLLALGPAGLLLAAVVYLLRLNEKLRDEHSKALAALQAKLDAEHQARLQDASANQRTLLEVHDRTHRSIDVLEKQMEQNEQLSIRRR